MIIELNKYDYTGSSNDIYGQTVTVDGHELFLDSLDTATILKHVLSYLGHDVLVIQKFNGEEQYTI